MRLVASDSEVQKVCLILSVGSSSEQERALVHLPIPVLLRNVGGLALVYLFSSSFARAATCPNLEQSFNNSKSSGAISCLNFGRTQKSSHLEGYASIYLEK